MTADDEMDQLFSVIGNMLTHSDISARHLWKKYVFRGIEMNCFTSLWLIRGDKGEPCFIQIMVMPAEACKEKATTDNNHTYQSNISNSNSDVTACRYGGLYGASGPQIPYNAPLEMRLPVPPPASVLQTYPVLHMFKGQSSNSQAYDMNGYLGSFPNGSHSMGNIRPEKYPQSK